MYQQMHFDDGLIPMGLRPVLPRVIFHDHPDIRRLPKTNRPRCAHCLMVAHAAATGRRTDVPAGFAVQEAVQIITQVDGSTLMLCEQHGREHEGRGDDE
jgi:hypothetical protein